MGDVVTRTAILFVFFLSQIYNQIQAFSVW